MFDYLCIINASLTALLSPPPKKKLEHIFFNLPISVFLLDRSFMLHVQHAYHCSRSGGVRLQNNLSWRLDLISGIQDSARSLKYCSLKRHQIMWQNEKGTICFSEIWYKPIRNCVFSRMISKKMSDKQAFTFHNSISRSFCAVLANQKQPVSPFSDLDDLHKWLDEGRYVKLFMWYNESA